MDHGSAAGNACKVEMLWNWNSKDACFLASGWQIINGGMMAASCIGVALLVVVLEVLRLMGKRLDATLLAQMKRRGNTVLEISAQASSDESATAAADKPAKKRCRPATVAAAPRRKIVMRVSPVHQVIRAVLHAVTFAVAYIVMLLAMSYNGYIIVSIIIGAGLGKFLTDWLTCTVVLDGEDEEPRAEGIEELTVCCQ